MVTRIFETFEAIGNTASTTDKTNLLKGLYQDKQTRELTAEMLTYCYDRYRNYYHSAKLPPSFSPTADQDGYIWQAYKGVLDRLRQRTLSGTEALQTIHKFLEACTPQNAKWLSRILNRDLEIGVKDKTILKAFPGIIVSWQPQKGEAWDLDFHHVTKPMLAEPKFDGYRCIAVKKEGTVSLLSFNGLPLYNLEHISNVLEAAAYDNMVLDGEVWSPEFGFGMVQKVCKTQSDKPNLRENARTLQFSVFDAISLNEWDTQTSSKPEVARLQLATTIVAGINKPVVRFSEAVMVHNDQQLAERFQFFVEQGYEGLMLKDPDAVYAYRRAQNWWKVKDFYEADLEIVGAKEGTEPSTIGTLGSITVKGKITWKGKEYDTLSDCGSGFKLKTGSLYHRDTIWQSYNAGTLVGQLAMIKFQEISENKEGGFSLRFPTFLRLRDKKDK